MTPMTSTGWLSYSDARAQFGTHPIRISEIPVEHAISLPVPTLRCGEAGYAGFAGPARRVPHAPRQLGAPDRWWVLGAQRRGLLLYCRTTAMPFTGELSPEQVTLPLVTRDLAAVEEDLRVLDALMDRAAEEFFSGQPASTDAAADLLATLTAYVSPAVMGWYRGLAPDFFGWLRPTGQEPTP
jgi:hypothetical protein